MSYLSAVRRTVGLLQDSLPQMDARPDGELTPEERDAWLRARLGDEFLRSEVEGFSGSERLSLLLGGLYAQDTHRESRTVALADARASLSATLAAAERVLPVFDPDGDGDFDLGAAKEESTRLTGVDHPLYSLDVYTRALIMPPDPSGAVQKIIQTLETEIASLEASNGVKSAEVNQLVSQISQRKSELEQEYDRKRNIGLVGAFFGVPAVAALSLIEMQRDDARLSELQRRLDQAQADQSRIASKLASYKQLKLLVETQVAALRLTEAALRLKQIASPSAAPEGTPEDVGLALLSAETLAGQRASLANLNRQRQLLTALRDAASSLGADLDQVIARLQQEVERAEQLVEASRKATLSLIRTVSSPDPEAAAIDRLRGMGRAELERALGPKVDSLVGRAPAPVQGELRKRFVSALVAGLEG